VSGRTRYEFEKRCLDVFGASLMLVISTPAGLLVAVAVRLGLGSPVLFRQSRLGQHGVPFQIMKFRTMLLPDQVPGGGTDADRLTKLGRALRATSLDELPSLWNVLRGEMSLVGPRPLPERYQDRYTPEQASRHRVPPGLTGWAQVRGRNALSWDEKFSADLWYIEHRGFWLDCQILVRTVWTVLSRRGISARGEATAPEFLGSSGPAT
jgi:lipopolysaccharide/colanic/teichoic acid biosynthesis glycosyltransferase